MADEPPEDRASIALHLVMALLTDIAVREPDRLNRMRELLIGTLGRVGKEARQFEHAQLWNAIDAVDRLAGRHPERPPKG
jgi:hypothetical protein